MMGSLASSGTSFIKMVADTDTIPTSQDSAALDAVASLAAWLNEPLVENEENVSDWEF